MNAVRLIIDVAAYFNIWAQVASWLWWLCTDAPSAKEVVEQLARDGIIGMEVAKIKMVLREFGKKTKWLDIAIGIAEYVYDTVK